METGDFNGDGYCDVAYSAPRNYGGAMQWYPGYAFIYAGNGELADTTVSNDDNIIEPVENVRLKMFPNPADGKEIKLNYRFEGDVPKLEPGISVSLYNIKGQLVTRHSVSADEIKNGTGLLFQGKLKRGMYIAALNAGKTRITSTKVTIK